MAKKVRGFISYRTYMFKDKDPIIDKLRTVVKESGETYEAIHATCGVTTGTLYNWFKGGTLRPQFATLMAVARALDYDLVLQRRNGKWRGR